MVEDSSYFLKYCSKAQFDFEKEYEVALESSVFVHW